MQTIVMLTHVLPNLHASLISSNSSAPSPFWLSVERNEYTYCRIHPLEKQFDFNRFPSSESHFQPKHPSCIDNWSHWQSLWSFFCQSVWREATKLRGKIMHKNFSADCSTPSIQRVPSASVDGFAKNDINAETVDILSDSFQIRHKRIKNDAQF